MGPLDLYAWVEVIIMALFRLVRLRCRSLGVVRGLRAVRSEHSCFDLLCLFFHT